MACLEPLLTQGRRDPLVKQEAQGKTELAGRVSGDRLDTPGPLEAWAKRVQRDAQARLDGPVPQGAREKEEQMALQGILEPQALREVLARQVLRELQVVRAPRDP